MVLSLSVSALNAYHNTSRGFFQTVNWKMKGAIQTTAVFEDWVKNLKDRQAVLAITQRLDRATKGNLGNIASVGGGVSEMRLFVGQGYRLYFTMRGGELVILLCGGDKSSQQRNIKKAKEMANNL